MCWELHGFRGCIFHNTLLLLAPTCPPSSSPTSLSPSLPPFPYPRFSSPRFLPHLPTRGGHAQLFFGVRNRNSATWRKNFRNRNSATFKGMLLRNHNSAIPQSQFFLKSTTWEFHFRNFRHIFGRGVTGNYIFFTPKCFLLFRGF